MAKDLSLLNFCGLFSSGGFDLEEESSRAEAWNSSGVGRIKLWNDLMSMSEMNCVVSYLYDS